MSIEDQQRFKDMDNLIKTVKMAKAFLPELMDVSEEEIAKNEKTANKLKKLADEFNELFLSRGWVATAYTSAIAAEGAIQIAKTKGLEEGEKHIEDYYNDNWDSRFRPFFSELQQNPKIKEAFKRRQFIEKALEDHKEERYYASVQNVAIQIDGIMKDLTGETFYRKKDTKHLQATETFAGDPSALPELAKKMSENRDETSSEPLDFLYRHGILHGRDMGYDNRHVSTKALATLLSLTELMQAIRKDEQYKIPEPEFLDPETATWNDIEKKWKEILEIVREYRHQKTGGEGPD